MKTVKLFSQNSRTAGTTTTLPLVGRVTFDKDKNFIEVDEDIISELQKMDFGIELLTQDEIDYKTKKVEEVKNQLLENKKIIPLAEAFEKLKEGRSEEEISYLNGLIQDLNNSNNEEYKNKISESETMLKTLNEKELKDLLVEYPEKDKKKLKTTKDIIEFLAKKMVKSA